MRACAVRGASRPSFPQQLRAFATATSPSSGEAAPVKKLPNKSFSSLLNEAKQRFEHRDALVAGFVNCRWTFVEVHKHSDALAAGLSQIPIKTHSLKPLATFSDSLVDNITFPFAAGLLGTVYSPLLPAQTKESLEKHMLSLGASVVAFPPRYGNCNNISLINEVVPEVSIWPDSGEPIKSKFFPELKMLLHMSTGDQHGMLRVPDLLWYNSFPSPLTPPEEINPQHPLLVLPNNLEAPGSKYSVFSNAAVTNAGSILVDAFNIGQGDRVCIGSWRGSSPLAFMSAALHVGAIIVFEGPTSIPEPILRSLERDHVTHALFDLPIAQSILTHPLLERTKPPQLRTIILQVSPNDDKEKVSQVAEELNKALKAPVVQAFIHPDVCGPFAMGADRNTPQFLPHVEGKVVKSDSSGKGDLLLKGPQIMSEYWRNSDTTKQVLENGWLNTKMTASLKNGLNL